MDNLLNIRLTDTGGAIISHEGIDIVRFTNNDISELREWVGDTVYKTLFFAQDKNIDCIITDISNV